MEMDKSTMKVGNATSLFSSTLTIGSVFILILPPSFPTEFVAMMTSK